MASSAGPACPTVATNRRGFLKVAGAAAVATQLNLMQTEASLLAAETAPAGKPRVAVVHFRKAAGGGCVWPPSSTEELAATQQLLHKIMQDAAAKYGVDLSVLADRVTDVPATLEQVNQLKPDGLIAIGMDFDIRPYQLCQKRGQIPTIAYGNILDMAGSSSRFGAAQYAAGPHAASRVARHGRAAVRALWDVNHLKVLDCPCEGYNEELKTVGDTEEVKAIAEFYEKHAQAVEPVCQPLLLGSAKHYVVLRRMMERHGCNGVAVEGPLCVGAGTAGNLPACLALSKLLDEGTSPNARRPTTPTGRLTSSGWRLRCWAVPATWATSRSTTWPTA